MSYITHFEQYWKENGPIIMGEALPTPYDKAKAVWFACIESIVVRMAAKPDIIGNINGEPISMQFWRFVLANFGGNDEETARVFYRAKVKAKYIATWITTGIIEGYAGKPCVDEDERARDVAEWVGRWLKRVAEVTA
jgi:hypothetical protein